MHIDRADAGDHRVQRLLGGTVLPWDIGERRVLSLTNTKKFVTRKLMPVELFVPDELEASETLFFDLLTLQWFFLPYSPNSVMMRSLAPEID